MNDIQIAHSVTPEPIYRIASMLGLSVDDYEQYGKFKAKITTEPDPAPRGKLILVTAINPTPYGEGKTTVSIGLADGLRARGKKVCLALREPSLGPVFGIKGGAAGGGRSQLLPMEDINLHFTGDFHAVSAAHNLLSALIDNHIKQGNELDLDPEAIEWKRTLDVNDRALREIRCGLGGEINGVPRTDGFVITAASEIMAIMCLAENLADLKARLASVVVGKNRKGGLVTAGDLGAEHAMAILLKDAMLPNLVQTLEHTPAIVHCGPFANIAQGTNSVRATKLAMTLADYAVTEAGFGAELGAEKFFDIKCRAANLTPAAVVLVATVRALKHNGNMPKDARGDTLSYLEAGLCNLLGHLDVLHRVFGVTPVVAVNRFPTDTDAELQVVLNAVQSAGYRGTVAEGFAKGGEGMLQLADLVAQTIENTTPTLRFAYSLASNLRQKIEAIATTVYGAGSVTFSEEAEQKLLALKDTPYDRFPVCIAKTQYSFSQDPALLGRPKGFPFFVRDIELRAGARFVVALAGNMLLMPGLPKVPAALRMTISDDGLIDNLS